jgi:hypothetical protein
MTVACGPQLVFLALHDVTSIFFRAQHVAGTAQKSPPRSTRAQAGRAGGDREELTERELRRAVLGRSATPPSSSDRTLRSQQSR